MGNILTLFLRESLCTKYVLEGSLKKTRTLAGVAQWIERPAAKQRVASSIPSQGTCLGCRPGPQ